MFIGERKEEFNLYTGRSLKRDGLTYVSFSCEYTGRLLGTYYEPRTHSFFPFSYSKEARFIRQTVRSPFFNPRLSTEYFFFL